jgi:hypothetical protein
MDEEGARTSDISLTTQPDVETFSLTTRPTPQQEGNNHFI